MRIIRVHALLYLLSPVGVSSDSLHIYLEIFRSALLGVGWWGRFSSHAFSWCVHHGCLFAQFGFVYFYKCSFPKYFLDNSWGLRSVLEDYPFYFDIQSFLDEAPKLPENVLTVSARSGSSVPSDLLSGLWSCFQVSDNLNTRLAVFWGDLACPKGSLFSRGVSKALRSTACFPVSKGFLNYLR